MPPKILFVDHTATLGGGELSLLDIARHFRESCRVILLSDGPFRKALERVGVAVQVLAAGAPLQQVPRQGGLLEDLKAFPGVLKVAGSLAVQSRGFDLIYANSQKSMVVAGVAGLIRQIPVIWHLRDFMCDQHFSKLHRRLTAHAARVLIDRVIANSEATRRAFIANGARPSAIHVVHNGIDACPFEAVSDHEVLQLRSSLGLNGVPVVGVFSRLARWKGQHVLLEALPALPNVHAALAGEAMFEGDRAYLGELLGIVARLKLQDRVHFLGFRDDVPRLLRMCDIVVHTSIAPEPFGRVIVEGMLAGRPVIATQAGGALEIIEDGRTGRLVPPGDASALGKAISQLLMADGEAREIAERGRRAGHERFCLEGMIAGVTQHISEVSLGRT